MQFIEFRSNNYTFVQNQVGECQLVIEHGVYSTQSQIVCSFQIVDVAGAQIVYNRNYLKNLVKSQVRNNNILIMTTDNLTRLQRDNHCAEQQVDYFTQNLYDGAVQVFDVFDKNDYQPVISNGNTRLLIFNLQDFFPCFTGDFIEVKNQLIINFQFLCSHICKSIAANNAVTNVEPQANSAFYFAAQLKNYIGLMPTLKTFTYCDQQKMQKADNDYMITINSGEQIYSLMISAQGPPGANPQDKDQFLITRFHLYINQLPIITANNAFDVREQIRQYRINNLDEYVINFKQPITESFSIRISTDTPENHEVYVTYFMDKQ